jgi:hypothetical protein
MGCFTTAAQQAKRRTILGSSVQCWQPFRCSFRPSTAQHSTGVLPHTLQQPKHLLHTPPSMPQCQVLAQCGRMMAGEYCIIRMVVMVRQHQCQVSSMYQNRQCFWHCKGRVSLSQYDSKKDKEVSLFIVGFRNGPDSKCLIPKIAAAGMAWHAMLWRGMICCDRWPTKHAMPRALLQCPSPPSDSKKAVLAAKQY